MGWTIQVGTASFDGTAGGYNLFHDNATGLVSGTEYEITIDVASNSDGVQNNQFYLGNEFVIQEPLPAGVHTFLRTLTTTGPYIQIYGTTGGNTFVLNSVSVKVK